MEKTYTPDPVPPTASKKVRKVEEVAKEESVDALKDPITFDDFPLNKVKNARIVEETEKYRMVKIYNCPVELRLYKTFKN